MATGSSQSNSSVARWLRRRLPERLERRLPPRPLPHGWRDAVLQLALWVMADLLYEGVRGLVVGHQSVALANGRSVASIEKTIGIFHEVAFQSWFLHHDVVVDTANWLYANVQFTVNGVFLAFLYVCRNQLFYFVRNMFFVAMGIALVVHLALPVAPPRMLPQYGFVDTIQQYSHINQDSGAISLFVNPYAAVPSMHVAFALLVGITGLRITRRRALRALGLAYPVVVLVVVVMTANHFFLDAITGACTAAAAALVAHRVMGRLRPYHWAWVPVPRVRALERPDGAEARA